MPEGFKNFFQPLHYNIFRAFMQAVINYEKVACQYFSEMTLRESVFFQNIPGKYKKT